MLDCILEVLALFWSSPRPVPDDPQSIFVLRNNDIGDVLVVTPLFDALRRRFPTAQIVAGVGRWSAPVLLHNPHLSEWIELNAPWHNKYTGAGGFSAPLRYVCTSSEVAELARCRFDIGIDVLGSSWGSLLLMRAGIPCRLGVKGYGGGHRVTSRWIAYDPQTHVSRAALRFAELLGAIDLPPAVPQLFLTESEVAAGEARWSVGSSRRGAPRRVVLAPGGGLLEKRWPAEHFLELARLIGGVRGIEAIVIGGASDRALATALAGEGGNIRPVAGELDLREVFAVIAAADAVVTNPSFPMHAAAAFGVRTLVVLGPLFSSAAEHEVQWGYPATQRTFGPVRPGASVADPIDVFRELMR